MDLSILEIGKNPKTVNQFEDGVVRLAEHLAECPEIERDKIDQRTLLKVAVAMGGQRILEDLGAALWEIYQEGKEKNEELLRTIAAICSASVAHGEIAKKYGGHA